MIAQIEAQMVRIESHVQRLMDERGLTRSQVVYGAQLTYQTVSKWANNQVKRPDPSVVYKLARFFGVSESELYSTFGNDTPGGESDQP